MIILTKNARFFHSRYRVWSIEYRVSSIGLSLSSTFPPDQRSCLVCVIGGMTDKSNIWTISDQNNNLNIWVRNWTLTVYRTLVRVPRLVWLWYRVILFGAHFHVRYMRVCAIIDWRVCILTWSFIVILPIALCILFLFTFHFVLIKIYLH